MYFLLKGKRIIGFCLLLFVIIVSGIYSQPNDLKEAKLDLKITGGITHISGGDWNTSMEGRSEWMRYLREQAGSIYNSELDFLDGGKEFDGQIVFYLSPNVALGVGAGYIDVQGFSRSTTTTEGVTGNSGTDYECSAIPVTFGFYYFIPVSPKIKFSVGAGAGYYFARFSADHRREDGDGFWVTNEREGTSGDFGFHGGIGFEYSLSQSISIVVEGVGRYAKIDGFEGIQNRADANGWRDSTEGSDYWVEYQQQGIQWFPRVIISAETPSNPDYKNVRSAVVDFSGFALRIGLKIKLF